MPGEAGRSLVKAYFEIEHSTLSILHPQGQDASTSTSAPLKTPARPRKLPARNMTPSGRRSLGAGLNTGTTPGLGSQPQSGIMGRGCWVRQSGDLPPYPLSMDSINLGSWSIPRAVAPQRRLQSYPGLKQSPMPQSGPQPVQGHLNGGEYGPTSNFQYSASSQAPSSRFQIQVPFNRTPRPASRPYVTYQSYGDPFLAHKFSERQ